MRSNHQGSEVSDEIQNSENFKEDEGGKSSEEDGLKSNLFGVKFVMWFEIGIEGKDPMDQDEEDWGGKIEFGFKNKNFP